MQLECSHCGLPGPRAGEACPHCGARSLPRAEPHLADDASAPAGEFGMNEFGMSRGERSRPATAARPDRGESDLDEHGLSRRPSRVAGSARAPAPAPLWLRAAGGALATVLISAAGSLAIYFVHRTMPALHPSFQTRAPAPPDLAASPPAAATTLQAMPASHTGPPPTAKPTSMQSPEPATRERGRPAPARAPRG